MKKYLLIALTLTALISCTKTNVTFKHHWIAQEGHDRTTWSHAAFCDASDYLGIDTVELDNTALNDSTKFDLTEGSIYFHPKNGRVPTDIPDIYDRNYCQLLKQID